MLKKKERIEKVAFNTKILFNDGVEGSENYLKKLASIPLSNLITSKEQLEV